MEAHPETGPAKKPRIYRDPKTIERILEDYRQSGLSQVAYAREHGLPVGTLRGWLYKSRKSGVRDLCEVVMPPQSGHLEKAVALVRLANGSEVELPLTAGLGWVERMIGELTRG